MNTGAWIAIAVALAVALGLLKSKKKKLFMIHYKKLVRCEMKLGRNKTERMADALTLLSEFVFYLPRLLIKLFH